MKKKKEDKTTMPKRYNALVKRTIWGRYEISGETEEQAADLFLAEAPNARAIFDEELVETEVIDAELIADEAGARAN
jgi:hypothetical protein